MLLNRAKAGAIAAIAAYGAWLFASESLKLAHLSWWYDSTQVLLAAPANPDYDLSTLPWQAVHPRQFAVDQGRMTLVTSAEPYGYQVFATIPANGANTAGMLFDADVERGAISIGIQQAGEWLAINSSRGIGRFADLNSALLGFRRSLTIVIANRNADGESRVTLNSLRIYLRK